MLAYGFGTLSISRAASTTRLDSRCPGLSVRREIGPLMLHRRPELPFFPEHRGADARDAGLPLGDALGPTPDPYPPELGRIRPVIDTAGCESQQHLARGTPREA